MSGTELLRQPQVFVFVFLAQVLQQFVEVVKCEHVIVKHRRAGDFVPELFVCCVQVVQQFLEAVNYERVKQQSHRGAVTWSTGVKFLMARKFDLKRACDLYFAHEVGNTLLIDILLLRLSRERACNLYLFYSKCLTRSSFFFFSQRHSPSFCFQCICQIQNMNSHLIVSDPCFKVPHILLLHEC